MATPFERIGEFGFIERISKGCLIRPEDVICGIGDDAAVVALPGDEVLLLTTDMLVAGVHFAHLAISGFDLGHKALAVNLSDIAAMGGIAREALVSIAIPRDCPIDFIEDLYRGMKSLAAEYGVNIIGGDTSGSLSDLMINLTVTGRVERVKVLRRNRARAGDVVCLTGFVGESAAGLRLILNQNDERSDAFDHLRRRHCRPRPHLPEGRWLADSGEVHAAIDVSDGLSSDLGHVIRQSGVGARIDIASLPVSAQLRAFCRRFETDPLDYMLKGGEDYILLVTVAPGAVAALARGFETTFGRPLHRVGVITDSGHIEQVDKNGISKTITPRGWDHFRKGKD